jgi:hypothetical protein
MRGTHEVAGPLGPAVDALLTHAIDAFLGPGTGDHSSLQVLLGHALLSLACCLVIFVASTVLSPMFFSGAMAALEPYERKVWHSNMAGGIRTRT